MNINAGDIQKSSYGSQIIEGEIKKLLATFQSEILEASKNGYTKHIISVPTNFNIANMSNQTAQTIIYYRLIEELESKGFDVKLTLDNNDVSYYIRWGISKDDNKLNNMRNIIAKHILPKEKE